jgi:hypothetical protein
MPGQPLREIARRWRHLWLPRRRVRHPVASDAGAPHWRNSKKMVASGASLTQKVSEAFPPAVDVGPPPGKTCEKGEACGRLEGGWDVPNGVNAGMAHGRADEKKMAPIAIRRRMWHPQCNR